MSRKRNFYLNITCRGHDGDNFLHVSAEKIFPHTSVCGGGGGGQLFTILLRLDYFQADSGLLKKRKVCSILRVILFRLNSFVFIFYITQRFHKKTIVNNSSTNILNWKRVLEWKQRDFKNQHIHLNSAHNNNNCSEFLLMIIFFAWLILFMCKQKHKNQICCKQCVIN